TLTDDSDFPAGNRRFEHCQIRLSACRRECSGDESLLSLGVSDSHDQHVLCHPSLVFSDVACDSEGEALLSQQRVSTLSRSERPDLSLLRSMGNEDLLGVAWPVVDHLLSHRTGKSYRMNASNEVVVSECIQDGISHSSHRSHAENDVARISQFNSNLGERSSDWSHREGNHVHRATIHASGESPIQLDSELFLTHPLTHDSLHSFGHSTHAVILLLGDHIRLTLDSCYISRISAAEVIVLVGLQGSEYSSLHQLVHDVVCFLLRPEMLSLFLPSLSMEGIRTHRRCRFQRGSSVQPSRQ
ncbi:hypothetical protein PMAYCL1PPCAC_12702, partial [Pristionchus mayeri]